MYALLNCRILCEEVTTKKPKVFRGTKKASLSDLLHFDDGKYHPESDLKYRFYRPDFNEFQYDDGQYKPDFSGSYVHKDSKYVHREGPRGPEAVRYVHRDGLPGDFSKYREETEIYRYKEQRYNQDQYKDRQYQYKHEDQYKDEEEKNYLKLSASSSFGNDFSRSGSNRNRNRSRNRGRNDLTVVGENEEITGIKAGRSGNGRRRKVIRKLVKNNRDQIGTERTSGVLNSLGTDLLPPPLPPNFQENSNQPGFKPNFTENSFKEDTLTDERFESTLPEENSKETFPQEYFKPTSNEGHFKPTLNEDNFKPILNDEHFKPISNEADFQNPDLTTLLTSNPVTTQSLPTTSSTESYFPQNRRSQTRPSSFSNPQGRRPVNRMDKKEQQRSGSESFPQRDSGSNLRGRQRNRTNSNNNKNEHPNSLRNNAQYENNGQEGESSSSGFQQNLDRNRQHDQGGASQNPPGNYSDSFPSLIDNSNKNYNYHRHEHQHDSDKSNKYHNNLNSNSGNDGKYNEDKSGQYQHEYNSYQHSEPKSGGYSADNSGKYHHVDLKYEHVEGPSNNDQFKYKTSPDFFASSTHGNSGNQEGNVNSNSGLNAPNFGQSAFNNVQQRNEPHERDDNGFNRSQNGFNKVKSPKSDLYNNPNDSESVDGELNLESFTTQKSGESFNENNSDQNNSQIRQTYYEPFAQNNAQNFNNDNFPETTSSNAAQDSPNLEDNSNFNTNSNSNPNNQGQQKAHDDNVFSDSQTNEYASKNAGKYVPDDSGKYQHIDNKYSHLDGKRGPNNPNIEEYHHVTFPAASSAINKVTNSNPVVYIGYGSTTSSPFNSAEEKRTSKSSGRAGIQIVNSNNFGTVSQPAISFGSSKNAEQTTTKITEKIYTTSSNPNQPPEIASTTGKSKNRDSSTTTTSRTTLGSNLRHNKSETTPNLNVFNNNNNNAVIPTNFNNNQHKDSKTISESRSDLDDGQHSETSTRPNSVLEGGSKYENHLGKLNNLAKDGHTLRFESSAGNGVDFGVENTKIISKTGGEKSGSVMYRCKQVSKDGYRFK